jgi:anti-sigma B factor antagonist
VAWTDSGDEPLRYDGFDSFCKPAKVNVAPRNRRRGISAQDCDGLRAAGTTASLRDDSVNYLTVVTTPRTVVSMLGELDVAADSTVVTLHGDLDLVTIEELRGLLEQACESEPDRVLIDLTDVPFVDVLSLSTILASADAVRDRGGLLLVRGASGAVRRICALLNAKDLLLPTLPSPRLAAN